MKRLVTLAIMVAFLLGTVGMVKAAELTISGGDFRVHGNYVQNPDFNKDTKNDEFDMYQRFRTNFNFVVNENLRAVVQLQITDSRFGDDVGMGTVDTVDFRQAYLQFNIPNTQIQVRAGHQYFVLPNTLGSHIWDSRAPGLVVSAPINDMVGVTLGYARLADDANDGRQAGPAGSGWAADVEKYSQDNVDMLFAIVPVTLDGMQFNPFAAYVHSAKASFKDNTLLDGDVFGTTVGTDWFGDSADATSRNTYFVGLNATIDMFDPIAVMFDFVYGSQGKFYSGNLTDPGTGIVFDASKLGAAAGWVANLAVQYNMDMFTPMVWGLYESGESSSSMALDKASRIMPTVNPWLNHSSFGFDGSNFAGSNALRAAGAVDGLVNAGLGGPSGKWGIGVKLQDITFIDKLTHEFAVAYYQGTNHKDGRDIGLFTVKDSAVEVNFDTSYQMYENLAAILELGYIKANLSEDTQDRPDDAAFKAAAGFRYRF